MINKKVFIPKIDPSPETYYGKGSVKILKYLDEVPKLFLISPSAKQNNNFERVPKESENLFIEEISNNELKRAQDLYEKYKDKNIKIIVGIGGGRVMDLAKIIRALFDNPEIEDFNMYQKSGQISLVCVPTTPGTGSHVSKIAIINVEGQKKPYVSKSHIPELSILDESFLDSLTKNQLMEMVADIFAHAAESSVSKISNSFTLEMANGSLKLLMEAFSQEIDFKKIMMAGHLAGFAQSNAFVGSAHAIAHSLEILLKISHGQALLQVLKPTLIWHKKKTDRKEYDFFLEVYDKLNLEFYRTKIDWPSSEKICQLALNDPAITTNPFRFDQETLMDLIKCIQSQN